MDDMDMPDMSSLDTAEETADDVIQESSPSNPPETVESDRQDVSLSSDAPIADATLHPTSHTSNTSDDTTTTTTSNPSTTITSPQTDATTHHPFSPHHIQVLSAILDTFIAPLSPTQINSVLKEYNNSPSYKPSQPILDYLAMSATSDPRMLQVAVDKITKTVLPDQLFKLKLVLSILSFPMGCFVLTGQRRVPFYELELKEREAGMLQLASSRLASLRGVFKLFKALSVSLFYGIQHPTVVEAIGYKQEKPALIQENMELQVDAARKDKKRVLVLECDVVIVGSGCGGSVVASELAQSNQRVLVLDKGDYYDPTELATFNESESFSSLYEMGGSLATEDAGLTLLAGSTWGGGSTVNWSASLEPPFHVRQEWAQEHQLDLFLSRRYQSYIHTVCERLGVSTSAIQHNECNKILVQGCKNLGYPCMDIPQNTASSTHACGWCTYGCPSLEKQSSMITWLKDAQLAGAKYIKQCYVRRIVHQRGRAIGVAATLSHGSIQRRLFVKANKVVVSAGSLHSPALLLRSKLKNKHIGQHLYLHPVTVVTGVFPERDIQPYNGSIMTAVSTAVQNVDGKGYGALLEVPTFVPGLASALLPWTSQQEHKLDMLQLNHHAPLIVLTRDRDTGRVYIDAKGHPRIEYTLSKHDEQSMMKGLEAVIRVLVAAGATTIKTTQTGIEPLTLDPHHPDPFTTSEYKSFLSRVLDQGIQLNKTLLGSAHQMGTCRMAVSPLLGVCNPKGETFEVKGLYVADASLFPTSSGVNPMITNYSLAYHVAQEIKKSLNVSKL